MSIFNNSFGFGNTSDFIDIQSQDSTGFWRTYTRVPNFSQNILHEMQQLKSQFPDQRTRAVDTDGRIVDML